MCEQVYAHLRMLQSCEVDLVMMLVKSISIYFGKYYLVLKSILHTRGNYVQGQKK